MEPNEEQKRSEGFLSQAPHKKEQEVFAHFHLLHPQQSVIFQAMETLLKMRYEKFGNKVDRLSQRIEAVQTRMQRHKQLEDTRFEKMVQGFEAMRKELDLAFEGVNMLASQNSLWISQGINWLQDLNIISDRFKTISRC